MGKSALVVNAYKRMDHGSMLTSCYAARLFLIAAAIYVDDIDLLHWGDSPITNDDELITQVRDEMNDFGNLVEATGGALKPTK